MRNSKKKLQDFFGQRDDARTQMDLTTRAFVVRSESINEKERSVDAILATENTVMVMDWQRFEILDEVLAMSGARFDAQVPLLDSHNRSTVQSQLGSTRNIRVEGDKLIGVRHFADTERAEDAWKLVMGGHLRDGSIGYVVTNGVIIEPGQSANVNGKTYTASQTRALRVATEWQLREDSVCPIGADQMAKMRSEIMGHLHSSPANTTGEVIPMKLNQKQRAFLVSLGLRADATDEQTAAFYGALSEQQRAACDSLSEQQRAACDSASVEPELARSMPTQAPPAPAPSAVPTPDEIRRQATEAERQRSAQIRELAGDDVPAELAQRAVNEGWDVNRASREFLTAVRERRAPAAVDTPNVIVPRELVGDQARDAIASGLMQRCNLEVVNSRASETERRAQEQRAEQGRRYAWMSLFDMCREVVALTGGRDPMSGSVPTSREGYIRAAVSGGALTSIFTTSVNARLMASYGEAPDTTRGWTSEEDVADFKTNDIISLGKSGSLKKLGRGGSAQHATISDGKESYKIARYANQFVIDEQDIIDDNLGALMRMPTEMGLAAARLRPDLVYAIMMSNPNMADGAALFVDATHANLTNTALAAASLKTSVGKLRKQTKDGVTLNLAPAFLIVGTDLEFTARELLFSAGIVIAGTAGSVTERGDRNVVADLGLQLVIEGRLVNGVTDPSSGTTTAGAATKWFLTASPTQIPTIVVGYLAGTGRRPQIRSFVLDRGQWGIGWDIKHDLGAKAADWRGMQYGAA